MNNFYVYEWIRLDTNEPFYVGKGQGDRAYSLKYRNKHFHNIVNKVGLENCAVVILHDNLTENEALEIECWYIHQYKYLGPYNLTNITDGGEGLSNPSEEVRRKMSESHTGEKNPMYGKKLSEEARRKISEARKGKKHTEEARRKMSEAQWLKGKGYLISGENNPRAKAIILIFPDGTEKEFRTIKDASLYLGGTGKGNCSTTIAIHRLLNGWIPKRSKWVGYSSMYLEDYEKLNKEDKLIS